MNVQPRDAMTSGAPIPAPAGARGAAGAAVATSRGARIARLSAGVVPGGVSFDKPALRIESASRTLSIHAAPADRNTAATGVALGRTIDVTV